MRDEMKQLILIAGPCVIESYQTCAEVAIELAELQARYGDKVRVIFKSSFDKANRTSISSYRGVGVSEGIEILTRIHDDFKIPITTDFHTCEQVSQYGSWFDVIQIPALLSRQTDLIASAARVGVPVNVKKGQFMAPGDVAGIKTKFDAMRKESSEFWITERGSCFGFGRLVVDFTGFETMRRHSDKVIMDCTHSNNSKRSDGETLARCAIAAGADGLFIECHPSPDSAKCDGPNSLELSRLGPLIESIICF
jgi:2-dehydro-3-deoxyphosphooctonate aldolase (KDO 8-P synthase)